MIACGLWKTWNKVQIKVTKHLYHTWLEYSNGILLCIKEEGGRGRDKTKNFVLE